MPAPYSTKSTPVLDDVEWESLLRRRIIDENGCWLWTGPLNNTYPQYKRYKVHRLSAAFYFGPSNLNVLHTCDIRACFNPEHLYYGTPSENVRDRQDRSRQTRGEYHPNAKLTMDQVREIRAAYNKKKETHHVIAARWGVATPQIWHIVNNKTYREE